MSNCYELILDALNGRGKSIKDLEETGILGKNTFYIFKHTMPSLTTIIKIADYLQMLIDYILDLVNINNHKKYSPKQNIFYANLIQQMSSISRLKICADLGFSRSNFSR